MGRSIVAIIAGFVVAAALATGADFLVRLLLPASFNVAGEAVEPRPLIAALIYTFTSGAIGSYVAALIARRRPMLHAMLLGSLALALSIPTTVHYWHTAPAWYHLGMLACILPAAWLGGAVFERRRAAKVAPAAAIL